MSYKAETPGETAKWVRELIDELHDLRSRVPPKPKPRYVLRYTVENINGVTVIVGIVERGDECM